jgi:hypothetical protein
MPGASDTQETNPGVRGDPGPPSSERGIAGGGAAAVSEELIVVTKRQVNDVIREALRDFRDDEPLAFFCECRDGRCSQVVWLTGPAYDQARAAPAWLALVPGHLAADDGAKAVVSSAGAALEHDRTGRVNVGADD